MLPELFLERLSQIIPDEFLSEAQVSFAVQRPVSLRINTLLANEQDVKKELKCASLDVQSVPWDSSVLFMESSGIQRDVFKSLEKSGKVYRQSLASLVPVVVLSPLEEMRVLDLCAAPGSKTSQMAAVMKNSGQIVAVEAIRNRYFRLRSVLDLLGVTNVQMICLDGRRYQPRDGLFDCVLVDAPCSSEGRFRQDDPKSVGFWSLRKIKEMVRKQRGLLRNGLRCLKPGGRLIYATCTLAPEENEGVVTWALRKEPETFLQQVSLPDGVRSYPALSSWLGKDFDPRVSLCKRLLPCVTHEAFFIAQFSKGEA